MSQRALVTGGAGFIGSHLVDRLLADGWHVTVLDNFDDFYDPAVKRRNIAAHAACSRFALVEGDLRDPAALERLDGRYDVIVHLAARAGVRPSIEAPRLYNDVNVTGTQALLERCRTWGVTQFVFASSSSVYGVNPSVPWREDDLNILPISPYASTKMSGELLGHVYSHLYGIRFIALRFFTVYGPRQRPDLAIHKFARMMRAGQPIPLFGAGDTRRDYTYVDDTVSGILGAMRFTATPFEVLNLGNDAAIGLLDLVRALERALGVRAVIDWQAPQPGDVPQTWASIDKARRLLGYAPATRLDDGLNRFVTWLDEESISSPASPRSVTRAE